MCIDGPRATKTPCDRAQKSDTYFSAVNHGAVDHCQVEVNRGKVGWRQGHIGCCGHWTRLGINNPSADWCYIYKSDV